MKKIFIAISRYPLIIIFFIMLFFYFPSALALPAESTKKTVATSIGIDYENGLYGVSITSILPIENTTFSEKEKVFFSEAETISDALIKLVVSTGKQIGLSHVDLIVCGEGLFNVNDIMPVLDHLTRSYDISNDTSLIFCNRTAKELMIEGQKLRKSSGLQLSEILDISDKLLYTVESTLETFFMGYCSNGKTCLIPQIKLVSNTNVGIDIDTDSTSTQSGESGGESDSQQSSSNSSSGNSNNDQLNYNILNDGTSILCIKGQPISILSQDEIVGFQWLSKNAVNGLIHLKQVNTANLNNAKMDFVVRDKSTNIKAYFENDKPVFETRLNLVLVTEEINQEYGSYEVLKSQKGFITPEVAKLIEQEIKYKVSLFIEKLKQYNADALFIYEYLSLNNSQQLNNFIRTLDSDKYLVDNTNFRLFVDIIEYF